MYSCSRRPYFHRIIFQHTMAFFIYIYFFLSVHIYIYVCVYTLCTEGGVIERERERTDYTGYRLYGDPVHTHTASARVHYTYVKRAKLSHHRIMAARWMRNYISVTFVSRREKKIKNTQFWASGLLLRWKKTPHVICVNSYCFKKKK